jgi:23S rRNA (guanosine2251-2'-O)-methyltransferase
MEENLEGRRPVLEALRAGRPILKILLLRTIGRHSAVAEILHMAASEGVPVEYVEGQVMKRLARTGHDQGVLAVVSAMEFAGLDDLLESSARIGEPPLYAVLAGIEDPHNLGAILRTADAAGVHGVVIPTRRAVGVTAAVARASAGAVEYVPVARVANIAQTLVRLGKEGVWVVGVDPEGSTDYTDVDYRQPTALVMGAEGKGIPRLVKERCDVLISIPMRGQVASLNTSVAAALVMYEAMRQRRESPSAV